MNNSQHPIHRVVVVANETVEGVTLHEVIRDHVNGRIAAVSVVAPALNSRMRHWCSDEDGARAAAQARLDRSLARLAQRGITATGWVGDADPMRAIGDALRTVPADEMIIATHPEPRSNWLAHRLVDRARAAHDIPVTHVVVDAVEHREYLAAA
jgi:GABA permease